LIASALEHKPLLNVLILRKIPPESHHSLASDAFGKPELKDDKDQYRFRGLSLVE